MFNESWHVNLSVVVKHGYKFFHNILCVRKSTRLNILLAVSLHVTLDTWY